MNEDGMPLRSVDESSFEYIIVTTIPRSMNITSMRPAAAPLKALIPAVKNIIMSIISVGKRPLQGMNELVTAAMTRSLGDDATASYAAGIASKSHTHGKGLLAVCTTFSERVVKIECNSGKITKIFK